MNKNSVTILLSASLKDDLNWNAQKLEAKKAIEQGFSVFWELDFGLCNHAFCPYESAHFLSYTLALDQFIKECWKEFEPYTIGISLYRGKIYPPIKHSEKLLHFFEEFLQDFKGDFIREDLFALFCVNLFSEYLHRLASFLPENLSPYCLLDLSDIASQAKVAQYLCKRRFEHFQLKEPFSKTMPTSLGICLPVDEKLDVHALKLLDLTIENLLKKKINFRTMSEESINEQWDGIEELIVFPHLLTSQGKRMLLGFEAAGGLLKEIGAEGFEPPTHCSQSSCASQTALCSDLDPKSYG